MTRVETYHKVNQQLDEIIEKVESLQEIAERVDDLILNRQLYKVTCFLSRAKLHAATGENAESIIEGLSPEGQEFVRHSRN